MAFEVKRYKYVLSLPERVLRSLSALSGGFLREIGEVALPAAVRRTTLYRAMVEVTLRFLIEDVGQVEGVYPLPVAGSAESFVLQRTASHGIDLLGILAFHASPVWVLAALADVAGGGHTLMRGIAEALEEEGLLEPGERFETMEQVLGGLEKTGSHLALTLNMPPIDVPGLRREWEKLKTEVKEIPPSRIPGVDLLQRTWDEMRTAARVQNRTVFTISSLMAISTLAHVPANLLWLSKAAHSAARRTTGMVGGAILDHYSSALAEIEEAGLMGYWKREFRPWLRAAAEQFAPGHETSTERILP